MAESRPSTVSPWNFNAPRHISSAPPRIRGEPDVRSLFSKLQQHADEAASGCLNMQEVATAGELLGIDRTRLLRLLYTPGTSASAQGTIDEALFTTAVSKAFDFNVMRREAPTNMPVAVASAFKVESEFLSKLADVKQTLRFPPNAPVGQTIAKACQLMGLPYEEGLMQVKVVNELHTLALKINFIKAKVLPRDGMHDHAMPMAAVASANAKLGLEASGPLSEQMDAVIKLYKQRLQPPWEPMSI